MEEESNISSNPETFNIEIKISKTDLPVPVIRNVHLHSIYNPERESNSLISANIDIFEKSSKILVFGLGFAYHLVALEKCLTNLYGKNFQVYVIEPNTHLVKKWKEIRPNILDPRIKIMSFDNVKGFYQNKELVEFMSEKPSIFPHQASFQLNESFFRSFMSFHYPSSIKESLDFIESPKFKNYLESFDTSLTTEEFLQEVNEKPMVQGYDFLTLAFKSIIIPEKI